jgi:hypothetical protein
VVATPKGDYMTISALFLSFAIEGTCQGAVSQPISYFKVYFGSKASVDPAKKDKVGTVRATDVYLQIPAYKELVEKGIDRDSAEGNKLMKKATATFKRAIRSAARASACVLVVEDGGVNGYPVLDITSLVIEAI